MALIEETPRGIGLAGRPTVVLCGTFRRDVARLRADADELVEAGCGVLSPKDLNFVSEVDGFVYAASELHQDAAEIEQEHLHAMLAADFIWLHAPEGYVGTSAAMELGFAHAHQLRVFSRDEPRDPAFRQLVTVLGSAQEAAKRVEDSQDAPTKSLAVLQQYYGRAARERGYSDESAQDCLLLLTEEVGELARAVRKSAGLSRAGGYGGVDAAEELADVQLYILHLANILGVELAEAVVQKERVNGRRHSSMPSAA